MSKYPKDVQLKYVRYFGENIQLFADEADEEVQLEAVKQNGHAIQHIKNPSLWVQLAAVRQNGKSIQHIEHPELDVQLAAVEQNGHAIEFISNPDEQVQLAAVQQNGITLRHLKDHAERRGLIVPQTVIDAAVKQYPPSRRYISKIQKANKDNAAIKIRDMQIQSNLAHDRYTLPEEFKRNPYPAPLIDPFGGATHLFDFFIKGDQYNNSDDLPHGNLHQHYNGPGDDDYDG